MFSLTEKAWKNLIEKENPSLLDKSIRAFLFGCSLGMKLTIKVRNWLYQHHLLAQKKCQVPVISIGNIIAGGAGKTPLTLLLAKTLLKHYRVAIVSRGYRKKSKKSLVIVSEGNGPQCSPDSCGDEAWLIAHRLPSSIVIVSKNRFQGANEAVRRGADVVVLDDGMQHRRLQRDVEIVVLKGEDPWGGHCFLPRGWLREDPQRLHEADLIVSHGHLDEKNFQKMLPPSIECALQPQGIATFNGRVLNSFEGIQAAVFCGLGNPQSFWNTLEKLRINVVDKWELGDHRSPPFSDLNRFACRAKANGANWLLCTEKDAVKLFPNEQLCQTLPLPLGWLIVEMEVRANHAEWEKIMIKIQQLIANSDNARRQVTR